MNKIFKHDKLNPSGGETFEIEIAGPYILYIKRVSTTHNYICVLAKKGLFGRSPLMDFDLYGYLPYVMTQGVNSCFDYIRSKTFFGEKYSIDSQVALRIQVSEWAEAYLNQM